MTAVVELSHWTILAPMPFYQMQLHQSVTLLALYLLQCLRHGMMTPIPTSCGVLQPTVMLFLGGEEARIRLFSA